jgi:hypothetical protein
MEYLMTYGWSILIIAVVLAALFALGIFGAGSNSGASACIPQSGFSCTGVLLVSNGVLSATFGVVGQTITITNTLCTQSASLPTSPSYSSVGPISLSSSQKTLLPFSCTLSSSNAPIGTSFSGYLWVQYKTSSGQQQVQRFAQVKAAVRSVGIASSPLSFVYNSGTGSAASTLSVSVTGSPSLVICGASETTGQGGSYSVSYTTIDAYDPDTFATVIGHQASGACTFVDGEDSDGGSAEVAVGIANPGTYSIESNTVPPGTSLPYLTLPIVISSLQAQGPANVIVIVTCSGGGHDFPGQPCDPSVGGGIAWPSQCSKIASGNYWVDSDGGETAAALTCQFSSAGTYNVVATAASSPAGMDAAEAAYIFG